MSFGFGLVVVEWVVGVMIDFVCGIGGYVDVYYCGVLLVLWMGCELCGSMFGLIGYG